MDAKMTAILPIPVGTIIILAATSICAPAACFLYWSRHQLKRSDEDPGNALAYRAYSRLNRHCFFLIVVVGLINICCYANDFGSAETSLSSATMVTSALLDAIFVFLALNAEVHTRNDARGFIYTGISGVEVMDLISDEYEKHDIETNKKEYL